MKKSIILCCITAMMAWSCADLTPDYILPTISPDLVLQLEEDLDGNYSLSNVAKILSSYNWTAVVKGEGLEMEFTSGAGKTTVPVSFDVEAFLAAYLADPGKFPYVTDKGHVVGTITFTLEDGEVIVVTVYFGDAAGNSPIKTMTIVPGTFAAETYDPVTFIAGYPFLAPVAPTSADNTKHFIRWKDNVGAGAYVNAEAEVKYDDDVTFTARWKQDWTVTYASEAGSTFTEAVTYVYTSNEDGIATFTTKTKAELGLVYAGKHFLGWNDGSNNVAAGVSKTTDSDVTLTARWQQDVYTITFHGETGTFTGGATTYVQNVTFNGAPLASPVLGTISSMGLTYPNGDKTFSGWSNSSGGAIVYSNGDTWTNMTPENKDLYAKWTQVTYQLTYNANYGITPTTVGAAHNRTGGHATVTVASSLATGLSGYFTEPVDKWFLGWSTDKDAITPTYVGGEELTFTKNTILYAIYADAKIVRFRFYPGIGETISHSVLTSTLGSGINRYYMTSETKMKVGDSFNIRSIVPNVPAGKIFRGWSTANDGNITLDSYVIDATTPPYSGGTFINFWAVWGTGLTKADFASETFWNYLLKFDADSNGELSNAEVAFVTEINVEGMNINSLSGINHFYNLTTLNIADITNTGVSNINLASLAKLISLKCGNGGLFNQTITLHSSRIIGGFGRNLEVEVRDDNHSWVSKTNSGPYSSRTHGVLILIDTP